MALSTRALFHTLILHIIDEVCLLSTVHAGSASLDSAYQIHESFLHILVIFCACLKERYTRSLGKGLNSSRRGIRSIEVAIRLSIKWEKTSASASATSLLGVRSLLVPTSSLSTSVPTHRSISDNDLLTAAIEIGEVFEKIGFANSHRGSS